MIPRIALVACLLAVAPASAAADRYMLDLELWINGEQRGTPMAIVEVGQPAVLTRESEEDAGGYRVALEVEEPGPGEGAPGGAVWIYVTVSTREDGDWKELVDSMIGVAEGRSGTVSVVEGEVEQPTPDNSTVFLRIEPTRLQTE